MNLLTKTISAIALVYLFTSWFSNTKENQQDRIFFQAIPERGNTPFCGHDELSEQLFLSDPTLKNFHELLEDDLYRHAISHPVENRIMSAYTLPVVVHIIHDNGPENISDATVLQGLQYLNNAFANIGYYDQGTGVNTEIDFCLATRNPDGGATTGITRDVSALTEIIMEESDLLRDINRWSPTEYINIWIVRDICSYSAGCGVAGFAFSPSSHGTDKDGIVIEASYMGSSNANASALIHEMGHYLGLYHTFKGGCYNQDCLSNGDKVCDTPPDQSAAVVPCSSSVNSCTSDVDTLDPNNPFMVDQNDMFWNYMDYSDFNCTSAFTAGQTARMDYYISGIRSSLLAAPSCDPPCLSPINASFSSSANLIDMGGSVTFNNTSTGANGYDWQIDGLSFNSGLNTSYTFLDEGTYVISLDVTNNDPNCYEYYEETIEVVCPVVADFEFPTSTLPINEVMTMTNNSVNESSIEWFIDGISQGNQSDLLISLANTAVVQVCLEATGQFCSDTHCRLINVIDTNESDCEITFFKELGNAQSSNGANVITPAEDGSYYIGGHFEDEAMILKMSPNSDLIWARLIQFFPFKCDIWDMHEDSDNNLIAVGSPGSGNSMCFKYDPINNEVIWLKQFVYPAYMKLYGVEEKGMDGNYMLVGQTTPDNSLNQGCEAFLMELDRDLGTIVWKKNYHLGACETIRDVLIDDTSILVAGSVNNADSGTDKLRGSLTRFDYDGNVLWSKAYLKSLSELGSIEATDFLIDEDKIISVSYGDSDSNTTTEVEAHLYATDLDGNIDWAMQYNIPDGFSERTAGVLNLTDGYMVYGYYNYTQYERKTFLIKTNKQGEVQWAKSYGGTIFEKATDIAKIGDFIYFTGTKGSITLENIFLARIYQDGELSVTCDDINLLEVEATSIPNPYQASVDLTAYFPGVVHYDYVIDQVESTATDFTDICGIPFCIEICDNGIDDDGDGLVDAFDPDCACSDTLSCEASFYNHCKPDCEFFPPLATFGMEIGWSLQEISHTSQQIFADVNGDCLSDIIAISRIGSSIKIINGDSGLPFIIYATNVPTYSHLAAADVDEDGMAEIFYLSEVNNLIRLIRLDYDLVTNTLVENWQSSEAINANGAVNAENFAPGIADFDYSGLPEIYVGNQIFNGENGLQLASGGANNQGTFYTSNNRMTSTSIAADVLPKAECDACTGLELVAGSEVYAVNIASYTNPDLNSIEVKRTFLEPTIGNVDGATRLVDFDRDGDLDVVVTTQTGPASGSRIFIWDVLTESQIGNTFLGLPNATIQEIGPASIGDVDNDGWPEIIVATSNNLTVLEDYQNGGGANWGSGPMTIKATTTTEPMGAIAASLFDLNGDGAVEIFHQDGTKIRIFDGDLGVLYLENSFSSGITTNYPLIADIDNDGQTEVLYSLGIGISIYRTTGIPWMYARKIWNQYSYFVTNVNDDGTIPKQQQNGQVVGDSIVLNGFLVQQTLLDGEGAPINPAPDAELTIDTAFCNVDSVLVQFHVCNNGSDTLTSQTPVAIYLGNPTTTIPDLVLLDTLGNTLAVDSCIHLSYSIPDAFNQAIYIVVNDNGSGNFPYDLSTEFPLTFIGECNFQNNIDSIQVNAMPPPELDLGSDVLVCENGTFDFNAGAGFDFYEWHDGTEDSTFTSFGAGVFWVTAWNVCGAIQTDTVEVMVDSATIFDLGQDTVLCGEGPINLIVLGYDDYTWFPNTDIDCDTCAAIIVTPQVSTTYTLVATTDAGCISVDSIVIVVGAIFYTEIDTSICEGTTFTFGEMELEINSATYFNYSTVAGCDSTILVNVNSNGQQAHYQEIDTSICLGTSILHDGISIPTDSIHIFEYQTITGCDSIIVLHVMPLDTFYASENKSICEGETILIFGNAESNAGDYTITYNAVNGCDSTVVISLEVFDTPEVSLTGFPSCPEDSTGEVSSTISGGQEPFQYQWNTTLENVDELNGIPVGTYSVTVSDANNCTDTASIVIADVSEASVFGVSTAVSCFGASDGIYEIDSTFVGHLFSLDGNIYQNTQALFNLNAGVYDLYIQDPNGCEYVQNFTIDEPPLLAVLLPPDTTIQLGCAIELASVVNRFDTLIYSWSPPVNLSCLGCPSPLADPLETTMYTLIVTDSSGCSAQEDILVRVSKKRNIYIPNVFSPNFDGLNDVFMIYGGKGVAEIRTFTIFDRWGEQLFEAKNFQPEDSNYGWDGTFKGKDMNSGVFIYWVEVVFVDGLVRSYKGTVTLVK